jgi:hypothetical protein
MSTALDPTAAEALVDRQRSTCEWCHAPIVWGTTSKDARMPLDVNPDSEGGNILLLADGTTLRAAVLGRFVTKTVWKEQGHRLRTRHALTCPQAEEWRHKRRTAPPTRRGRR